MIFLMFKIYAISQNFSPSISPYTIKSQVQLIDSNSINVCRGDSINLQIRVAGLNNTIPTLIESNIDSLFQSVKWKVEFPLSPNNFSVAFLRLSIPNAQSNKNFIPFYISWQQDSLNSVYATFDIRLIDSIKPNIYLNSNIIFSDVFNSTYSWFKDGNLIEGPSSNRIIEPSSSGVFHVSILSSCENSISNNLYYEITGLNENELSTTEKSSFVIYPNPTNSELQIETISKSKIVFLEVIDGLGIRVFSTYQIENTLDLSEFTKGVYFIRTLTEEGDSFIQKVQKI